MKRAITLSLILITCGSAALAQSTKPSLTLKDINGRRFRLAEYRGKVVLLNFWATWCRPCRTEIPDLIEKQREYEKSGLQIVGVTYPPHNLSAIRRFVRTKKVNYRVVIGTIAAKALFTNTETLPLTVVIDRDGAVRAIIEGVMYADEFDAKVKPLIISPKL